MGVLNEDTPTRIVGDIRSSPDITFASTNFLPITDWSADTILSSDHLPILITISRTLNKTGSDKKTYINIFKSRWKIYWIHGTGLLQLTYTILAGRIPEIVPNFPTAAVKLEDERDNIRRTNPNSPRIRELNTQISSLVYKHKKDNVLKSASFFQGPKNLWKITKNLKTNQNKQSNNVIHFNNKPISDPKKCSNEFNKQFTPHTQVINQAGKPNASSNISQTILNVSSAHLMFLKP